MPLFLCCIFAYKLLVLSSVYLPSKLHIKWKGLSNFRCIYCLSLLRYVQLGVIPTDVQSVTVELYAV